MFEAADIREWRGHDVIDPDGHKIGELEAVYTAWPTSRELAARGCWPGADRPNEREDPMVALFLLLVIAAIVLGIVGVVAKGLLYLLFIGIVVLLGALVLAALRMRRRPGRRQAR
jgi:Flp pilus assembly protein TadB